MLKDRHQREGDRRERRLALDVIQIGEVKVRKLGIERLADQAVGAIGFKIVGAPNGDLGRHLTRWLGFQTHRVPPATTDIALGRL
jgi:hypothetical protein